MKKKMLMLAGGVLATALVVFATSSARDVNKKRSPAAVQGSEAVAPAAVSSAAPKYREVTIPAGTRIGVRLDSTLSSRASRVEDPVHTTLVSPVKIRGAEIVPAGSHITGHVTAAQPSARVKGRARLVLRLRTLIVDGESYPIAAQISRIAPATKGEDAEKIGLPAAGGAVIGGILGGKKGAAIGAAAGGGAGAAVVLSTPGKEVSLPKGSVIALKLQRAVKVRVPIKS